MKNIKKNYINKKSYYKEKKVIKKIVKKSNKNIKQNKNKQTNNNNNIKNFIIKSKKIANLKYIIRKLFIILINVFLIKKSKI